MDKITAKTPQNTREQSASGSSSYSIPPHTSQPHASTSPPANPPQYTNPHTNMPSSTSPPPSVNSPPTKSPPPAKTTEKRTIKSTLKKLKGVKNIELIVAAIVCVLVLVVYFSGTFTKKESPRNEATTFSAYASSLETNLAKILSEVKGAGKVSVMITFKSGVEQVYAYSTDTQTNTNNDGVKETSITYDKNTIVVSGGQPVVIKEIMPLIKGVIVVAEGAGSIAVKLDIIKAVTALLEVESGNIEVFAKSKK